MGKKKFDWQDALSLAESAATAISATQTAFKEGNKTNLEAAEGGKSVQKASGSGTKQKDPGVSALNNTQIQDVNLNKKFYNT